MSQIPRYLGNNDLIDQFFIFTKDKHTYILEQILQLSNVFRIFGVGNS